MNQTSGEFWVPSDALVRSVRGLWAVFMLSEYEQAQSKEFPTSGDELVGSVRLYDAKILQTAGPMTKVSANLTDAAFIITEGTHRVGPGVEVVGVKAVGVEKINLKAGPRP